MGEFLFVGYRVLCVENRISGAVKIGYSWVIPADAEKPKDARVKSGKYIPYPLYQCLPNVSRELLRFACRYSIIEQPFDVLQGCFFDV